MEIKAKEVTFGAGQNTKVFEILPLPHGRASMWRREFNDRLAPQFDHLRQLPGMEFENPADLLKMLPVLQGLLIDAPDDIFLLVTLWNSKFEAAADWLNEYAYDEQLVDALLKMLEFADPFGLRRLTARQFGVARPTTLSNSQSPSGVSTSTEHESSSEPTTPSDSPTPE